jgi:hypothetical protein
MRASSGNAAFDDWRDAELARLDEERKKLDEMRREFDQHMRDLRMARDREEFDRFMAESPGKPEQAPQFRVGSRNRRVTADI